MKHPIFECLGTDYPVHLEDKFDRILIKIEQLWDTPEIHDYFSDLLIDKRGGRKGFPSEVLNEIIFLREYRELETFRAAEKKEEAIRQLEHRGIALTPENFLRAVQEGDQECTDLFVRSNFNLNVSDAHGNSPLLIALKKGYTIVAKILVDAGADPNCRDKLGLTPLLVACGKTAEGYQTLAERLIGKGAFINVRDGLGNTPLLLSLSGGSLEIAKLLIQKGADISCATRKGETALSLANQINDSDEKAQIIELLVGKVLAAKPANRAA